jgi:hypothetical protein
MNMQNDDNAVIRYLMKEMDPSEEVLMERAMMEDDDLLIEVESMRQTLRRLDDLPKKKPPAELTESLIEKAAKQHNQQSPWPSIPPQVLRYAAVLLIGMGLGSGLWMVLSSSSDESTDYDLSSLTTTFEQVEQLNADVKPWVDRENVIYYQDIFNSQSSDYKTIRETSMKKLTPVTESLYRNPGSQNIQLTGSSN